MSKNIAYIDTDKMNFSLAYTYLFAYAMKNPGEHNENN